MTNAEAMRFLIAEWIKMRDFAAAMLKEQLRLESVQDILLPEFRGRNPIAETGWTYRTHGIGVDVVHKHGRGGIDFDFCDDTKEGFAPPDWWRLQLFAKRAIHARQLPADVFEPLLENEDRFILLAKETLDQVFGTHD